MKTSATMVVGTLLLVGALTPRVEMRAQGAAQRLAAVRAGTIRFTMTLRPGVCGAGQNVWRTRDARSRAMMDRRGTRDVDFDIECDAGPGRVVIEKDDGEVRDLRFYVGGRWMSSGTATDLGQLSAREAAALLLGIARSNDTKAARSALFPLTLVDSVEVWSDLMQLARDDSRSRDVRRQSVFWLGQLAEAPATAGLDELAGEDALDRDVREQAVFALSQRPRDEGVPALVRVVRTSRDPALRRKALFWLGQSDDPRALALFEELLARR